MDPSIRAVARGLLDEGYTANDVITAVLSSPDFQEFAERLVSQLVADMQRAITRDREKRVDDLLAAAPPPPTGSGKQARAVWQTRAEARRLLVNDTFPLTNGEAPRWLYATAEQHDMRADWLETQATSVLATAARHRQAAAEIRAAGVSCLADLDAELKAAA